MIDQSNLCEKNQTSMHLKERKEILSHFHLPSQSQYISQSTHSIESEKITEIMSSRHSRNLNASLYIRGLSEKVRYVVEFSIVILHFQNRPMLRQNYIGSFDRMHGLIFCCCL